MKKTVIIAIFLVCLASIVALQFFGAPATVPPSGVYIDRIEITGVSLSNRTAEQTDEVTYSEKLGYYWFTFIPCENGSYTRSEESLASNPNRVKIEYVLYPEDADKSFLQYVLNNNDAVVLCEETDEVVFLKANIKLTLTLKESKANQDAQKSVTIFATTQSKN